MDELPCQCCEIVGGCDCKWEDVTDEYGYTYIYCETHNVTLRDS